MAEVWVRPFKYFFLESKKDISRTVSQVCMRSGYATNDPNEKLSQFWRSQKVKNLILFARVGKRSHEYRKTNKPSRIFQNTKCLKSCTSACRNQNTKITAKTKLQKSNATKSSVWIIFSNFFISNFIEFFFFTFFKIIFFHLELFT